MGLNREKRIMMKKENDKIEELIQRVRFQGMTKILYGEIFSEIIRIESLYDLTLSENFELMVSLKRLIINTNFLLNIIW